MKDTADSLNRRLIRPSLSEVKEQYQPPKNRPNRPKKSAPPDQTHAEGFYFVKQMQNRTPMVLVMRDGEEVQGTIEWYDRDCLKLNRNGAPNLVVYKDHIKYLYKAPDGSADD